MDPKFAAETYDEYTAPLADAVIGTPAGTTIIGPSGETTFVAGALAAGAAAKTGTGGTTASGGSTGAAGRVGAGGSTGTGGVVATGGSFGIDGGVATGGRGVGGSTGAGGSVGGSTGFGGMTTGFGGMITGVGGMTGGGGISGNVGGFGFWHFDDCSPTSHFLADSSGFGATAQQPLKAACVPGILGQGVQIRSAKDVIQVADEPQFTVTDRVAAAAWVHPNTVSGNQPIVIKRLNNTTSFSLGVHNGNIEMSVVLSNGKTLISSAPISAGVWTHVAGMYDGTFVFLFINGQQFGQVFGGATLKNVFAPLRFGATTQSQYFDGVIDDVFVSTQNIGKDQLAALSCIAQPSTMTVSPMASDVTPPNTNAHFTISVKDNDVGGCQARQVNAFFTSFEPGINTFFDFPPGDFQFVSPGQTATFSAEVSGTEDADPGAHTLPFLVNTFDNRGGFEQLSGQFVFNL